MIGTVVRAFVSAFIGNQEDALRHENVPEEQTAYASSATKMPLEEITVLDMLRYDGIEVTSSSKANASECVPPDPKKGDVAAAPPRLARLDVRDDENDHGPIEHARSIARFVGRVSHTYPTRDAYHAAAVDTWIDMHTDFVATLELNRDPARYGCPTDDAWIRSHREWCASVAVPRWISLLSFELEQSEWLGGFIEPTLADALWAGTLKLIHEGRVDGLSPDAVLPLVDYIEKHESATRCVEHDQSSTGTLSTTPIIASPTPDGWSIESDAPVKDHDE